MEIGLIRCLQYMQLMLAGVKLPCMFMSVDVLCIREKKARHLWGGTCDCGMPPVTVGCNL